MDPVSLLVGFLQIVGTSALTKVGENVTDETVKQAQSLCSTLLQKFPNSPILQAITAGQEIDDQQVVIEVEAIALDPEGAALLEQMRLLLDSNQALAAKIEALAIQAKVAPKIVQVMASDLEGENLRAKSMRQTAPEGSGSVEQTMLKNIKVTGDIDLGDLTQEA
jgi:hypothetical protein